MGRVVRVVEVWLGVGRAGIIMHEHPRRRPYRHEQRLVGFGANQRGNIRATLPPARSRDFARGNRVVFQRENVRIRVNVSERDAVLVRGQAGIRHPGADDGFRTCAPRKRVSIPPASAPVSPRARPAARSAARRPRKTVRLPRGLSVRRVPVPTASGSAARRVARRPVLFGVGGLGPSAGGPTVLAQRVDGKP